MTNDLLKIHDLKKYPYRINWEITQSCNFSCSYCINRFADKSTELRVHSPEEIRSFFDKTGVSWLILITGGEPFTYPGFIDVCKELEKNNYLQITTNLSTDTVYDFADRINPDRVFLLSASFHYLERANKNLIDDFIEKCLYLKSKGFVVLVNYLAHPLTMDRMEEDLRFFEQKGIDTFVLAFRGDHEERPYPDSYSEQDIATIKKYILDEDIELQSAFGKLNYRGHFCTAGVSYFFMNKLGDVSKCTTLNKQIGNLFNGTLNINNPIKPCIARNCNDVYCGVAAVTDKKTWALPIYLEERKYKRKVKIVKIGLNK
jgi:MoaA/NifB/PqqE/SkfB family radical SAM enzyme